MLLDLKYTVHIPFPDEVPPEQQLVSGTPSLVKLQPIFNGLTPENRRVFPLSFYPPNGRTVNLKF